MQSKGFKSKNLRKISKNKTLGDKEQILRRSEMYSYELLVCDSSDSSDWNMNDEADLDLHACAEVKVCDLWCTGGRHEKHHPTCVNNVCLNLAIMAGRPRQGTYHTADCNFRLRYSPRQRERNYSSIPKGTRGAAAARLIPCFLFLPLEEIRKSQWNRKHPHF